MSIQQDIYDTGSKTRPPMLNKENYVPWFSRLLRYAKSDPDREVLVNETFHEQKEDELTEKELKQIYAAVNSCETAQEIWLRVQQMMKGSDIGIQEKKAKLFNEWERFTSTDRESIESYYHRSQTLVLIAKEFKLNYSTPTKNNQRISSNPRNRQIAQPGMNMGQDRQMQMVGDCSEAVQNPSVQNVGNQNGLIVVPGIANQNPKWNGNVVAARAEGNSMGNNGNQIRCYNCIGLGHFARNCIVRPRRRDAAYLQTQLLIAQKEEAQASTSGAQIDKAPVYDSDGSAEVQIYESCYNNDIFNMFTQEEQYTELLKSIPEPYQVQQNDSNVISELLKEKSTFSSLREEKKRLKSDFKIRKDELLDKQIQLENKIEELDNILVKTGQSIQKMHMLSPKPDSFYHTKQKMDLGYQNPFYLKQAQQKQQSLYNGKVLLEKHDPPIVYDSEETLQLA
ncbi:integrase, catalytic region, zinc finger, CCHC-type containing protein [Tanacetum coccineum]